MKTIDERAYKYIGTFGKWHAFQSVKSNFDPEILMVMRARELRIDGSVKYYDPIDYNDMMYLRQNNVTPQQMLMYRAVDAYGNIVTLPIPEY